MRALVFGFPKNGAEALFLQVLVLSSMRLHENLCVDGMIFDIFQFMHMHQAVSIL